MILRTLENNGRISKSALAVEVDLSPSACIERMRSLERKKLILSYHARINLRLLAPIEYYFTAIELANLRYYDVIRFESYVRDCQRITECFALGGGIDYLLRIVAANVQCYQDFMDDLLQANIGIERYTTYICTKQVKDRCLAPIGSMPAA